VELPLPSPGGYVHHFDFDPGREWALCSISGQQLTGWILWDVSDGAPRPFSHETSHECSAVAIRPKAPEVVWAEEMAVRSWNVEEDKPGVEITFPEQVHWLRLSVDGKLVAINDATIYDLATGELKYKLLPPLAEPNKVRQEHMRQLLAIDEEGRAWATIARSSPSGENLSLVRFSPDGQTWEALVENLGSVRATLSPDRKLLATNPGLGRRERSSPIDLWSTATGKHLKQLGGHWNAIANIAFSPDGARLASVAMRADVVKIWSLEGLTPPSGAR
jgi:WD40 repeat protein